MKVAKIKDGFIVNISRSKTVPAGCIDVTDIRCNIGNPVIDGVPIPEPSRYHTLSGLKWIVTAENQTLKDDEETERTRQANISMEKEATGFVSKTLTEKKALVDTLFKDVPDDDPMKAPTVKGFKKIITLMEK